MIRPIAIKPGNLVAFVAPASPSELSKIEYAISLFESRGYRVTLGKCCLAPTGGTTWSDSVRAAELIDAWMDVGVRAVICVRGGYGSARLLNHLDFDRMVEEPKVFAGFSDITALHIALNRRGLVTFHSPMPATLSSDTPSWVVDSLFDSLEGRTPSVQHLNGCETISPGVATGRLVGGCLRLICDSLGTPDEIDTSGKILLVEDVDEEPHRVDAMFTHLLNAGKLQQVAGIVVGGFSGTDEKRNQKSDGPTWREIVRERLNGIRKPSIMDFPIGHRAENATYPLGASVRLDAKVGKVECLEPGARSD